MEWRHESPRPFSQSYPHAMVINKFSGLSTILFVKHLLQFKYSFSLKVFLLSNYDFLFCKLSIYSYTDYERHGKKLIIFLFLHLLHILSCHKFMSHSTQLQTALLKKQVFYISTEVMFS